MLREEKYLNIYEVGSRSVSSLHLFAINIIFYACIHIYSVSGKEVYKCDSGAEHVTYVQRV